MDRLERFCEACNKTLNEKSWKKHIRSQKHLENVSNGETNTMNHEQYQTLEPIIQHQPTVDIIPQEEVYDQTQEIIDSSRYWVINEPFNNDEVDELIANERSKYTFKEVSRKYVDTTFYNYITCYEDIQSILTQTYSDSRKSYRMNFSLGVITENIDYGDEGYVTYEVSPPTAIWYFTRQNHDNGIGKTAPFHPYVFNKRTLKENILDNITVEDIDSWLHNLLRSSSSKLIGIYSMAIKIIKMDFPIGCKSIQLPEYIINSNYMNSLYNIDNNLCFFACIALAEGCRRDRYIARTRELFCMFYGVSRVPDDY